LDDSEVECEHISIRLLDCGNQPTLYLQVCIANVDHHHSFWIGCPNLFTLSNGTLSTTYDRRDDAPRSKLHIRTPGARHAASPRSRKERPPWIRRRT
jgi:hypothetical protein